MNSPLHIEQTNIHLGGSLPFVKMLRTELLPSEAPGNKWFKLKYNVEEALAKGKTGILSFGGAHSNHLHAVAGICNKFGLQSIGLVHTHSNHLETNTIMFSKRMGMKIVHISDKLEFEKMTSEHHADELINTYGNFLVVPPGGNNANGLKGTKEILANGSNCGIVAVPVGYGTTLAGLVLSTNARVIGFPAVAADKNLEHRIAAMLPNDKKGNWYLNWDYSFGGFGKKDDDLIEFMNQFYLKHSIKLDPIYTGKMMYGIVDLLKKGALDPSAEILCIHTGGLQGISGFNERYPGALIYD